MIANRELGVNDYLAMVRRNWKLLLIPAFIGPLLGYMVSFALTPRYTSRSLVLVEGQKVPEGYVKPAVTEDITARIATMQQQVLSSNRLRPMVDRLGLVQKGRSAEGVMDAIRSGLSIDPVDPNTGQPVGAPPKSGGAPSTARPHGSRNSPQTPGFFISFTEKDPKEAQTICIALTSMLLEENLRARETATQDTTNFLGQQVEEAKRALNEQDNKLAAFKQQYLGQLPGDEDTNLKLLVGLNTQLDATTQSLNRAQQDKTYTESLLSQQIAGWKASQFTTSPQTLQQQLAQLQNQLTLLRSKYTDDHPDVIKARTDIAQVEQRIKDLDAASAKSTGVTEKASASEPGEIQQLRLRLHQLDQAIADGARDQKRMHDQIKTYESRVSLSPGIEEQYKALTRDYDTAQKFYNDLLANHSQSELQNDLERRQEGEQMTLLNPADLPSAPSFPNRVVFILGGLAVGLGIGAVWAFLLEWNDQQIRNDLDAVAAVQLPVLASLPWVGEVPEEAGWPPRKRKGDPAQVGA